MIEVRVLQANKDFKIQKNGTFLEGKRYFGRQSADGYSYVVRSEEGYWVVIENYKWAYNRNKMRDLFSHKSVVYMKNRKRLNDFDSVYEYFESGSAKDTWYSFIFNDVMLYG